MAKSYDVEVAPSARREIKKLNREVMGRVIAALEVLEHDARPRGVEKIQGHPNFYRIATADHRIIYHVRKTLVIILCIRDRKDAYKNLATLDKKLNHAMQEIYETRPSLFAPER